MSSRFDPSEYVYDGAKESHDVGTVARGDPQKEQPAVGLYERMRPYRNHLLLNKLQNDLDISRRDAEGLFEDVKRYMALCATTPYPLGLSRVIDQAWHTFILISRDYMAFCNEYCGRYIHHQPSDPFGPGKDYLSERLKSFILAQGTYGDLSNNWREPAAGCTHNCTNGD